MAEIQEFTDIRFTPVFWKNEQAWKTGARYVVNQGGTSSSKTISTLQLLYFIARNHNNLIISVVSETMPHLKKGALRDFEKMLKQCGAYTEVTHNKTDSVFRFQSGSMIEFFSADDYGKVHGPRRDILYINECNNISYDIFDQLEIRTKLKIFLDFNPVRQFWVHEEIIPKVDNCIFIKSTYKDNPYLPDQIRRSIEDKQNKSNWWRVYGLGEVGMVEGLIFEEIELVDSMPEEFKLKGYGLDFGFTNDPTALTDCRTHSGELWLDELIYETRLTNLDISNRMTSLGLVKKIDEIVADSAEPKSIYELNRYGWKVFGAVKGKDSVNYGIDVMNQYKINITKRSLNLITEFRNYTWDVDKEGKILNKPIDEYNHGIDGVRYWSSKKLGNKKRTGLKTANRMGI